MAKTKVKTDTHGIYVRGAGYIWRPVFPIGYSHVHEDKTSFEEGEQVNISHSGGPLARIRGENETEHWYCHGSYIGFEDGKRITIPSEALFKPSHNFWPDNKEPSQ